MKRATPAGHVYIVQPRRTALSASRVRGMKEDQVRKRTPSTRAGCSGPGVECTKEDDSRRWRGQRGGEVVGSCVPRPAVRDSDQEGGRKSDDGMHEKASSTAGVDDEAPSGPLQPGPPGASTRRMPGAGPRDQLLLHVTPCHPRRMVPPRSRAGRAGPISN